MRYNIEEIFNFKMVDRENKLNIVQKNNFRITIITNKIIKLEYNDKNKFTDAPTQKILIKN
jgi:hypothetical protein